MKRVLLVVAVVCLLTLTGCLGFLDDSQPAANTSTPVTPDANATATPTGTLNATTVTTQHITGLSNDGSYTARVFQRTEAVGANATPNRQDVYRTHRLNLSTEREFVVVERLRGGTDSANTGAVRSVEQYYNTNGTIYLNQTRLGQSQYDTQQATTPVSVESSSQAATLQTFIQAMAYQKSQATTVNGTAAVEYELAGITDMETLTQSATAEFTDVESTLVVDANGIVRQLSFSGVLTTPNQSLQTQLAVSYDMTNATVAEPAWLDNATPTATPSEPREPTVTISSQPRYNAADIELTALGSAEQVTITAQNGTVTYSDGTALDSVGETATVTNLSAGDQLRVINTTAGESTLLREYTYTDGS